jgi:asparagine synthase (glutamine-hydrolysing)
MCGIFGVLNFDGSAVDKDLVLAARDTMFHRGPDDGGLWMNHNIALGHRRLSILDLSPGGHQPFICENDQYITVFNGEIYNFLELKTKLELKGHKFKTKSDTEVLLKMYIEYGAEGLDELNGMFSFVIWNKANRTLFIARDRLGVKPLYYFIDGSKFIFASEQKAIIKYLGQSEIEYNNLNELLLLRHIAGEKTIFKGVKKVLPGYLGFLKEDGKLELSQWWNLSLRVQKFPVIKKPYDWFSEVFEDSIRYRMISDVNVGVLLSAGLDSTSVLRTIKNLKFNSIQSFNVGFSDSNHDESDLAKQFCESLEYSFNKIYVERDNLFANILDATYYHDEPIMHFNDPQILALSKVAKSKVSVLLSGEGADEILGGYVRYKPIQYIKHRKLISLGINILSNFIGNQRFDKLKSYYALNDVDLMIVFNGVNIYPNEFKDTYNIDIDKESIKYRVGILKEAKLLYPNNAVRQLLYLDQHTYLQSLNDRNDRATMGASIECREPFMDYRIVEGVGTLPNDYLFKGKKNKYLLSNSIGKQLPDYIRNFRKVGFSVPWLDYFKNVEPFRSEIEDLYKCDLFKHQCFDSLDIKTITSEFLKDKKHGRLITQLFFNAIWYNNYFKRIS